MSPYQGLLLFVFRVVQRLAIAKHARKFLVAPFNAHVANLDSSY